MPLGDKKLDKTVPIPLYFQLKELIISEIQSGVYTKDSLIPTEFELSDLFQISRTTVRQAITELVQEGMLYRVKSKGTFVSRPKINQDFMQKVETFNEQILRTGHIPSTEVIEFGLKNAGNMEAEKLGVKEGSRLVYLHRRRFADGQPVVIVETYLPNETCSFLLEYDFKKEQLYQLLSTKDETKIYCVKRTVEAVEANAKDQQYLDMKRGKPIQLVHSVGYNAYGQAVEYSVARYRGDRTRFDVTIFA